MSHLAGTYDIRLSSLYALITRLERVTRLLSAAMVMAAVTAANSSNSSQHCIVGLFNLNLEICFSFIRGKV